MIAVNSGGNSKEPGLKVLIQVVQQGWPHGKSKVPIEALSYFTSHDELPTCER